MIDKAKAAALLVGIPSVTTITDQPAWLIVLAIFAALALGLGPQVLAHLRYNSRVKMARDKIPPEVILAVQGLPQTAPVGKSTRALRSTREPAA